MIIPEFHMGTNEDIKVTEAIRVAIGAVEREDYEGALRLFREVYGRPELDAPPDGLSHYGLCVAIAEKQTNKGAQLCEEAIEAQFYDSSHHINLVRIHLKKGSRRRAIRALTRGLKRSYAGALRRQSHRCPTVSPERNG